MSLPGPTVVLIRADHRGDIWEVRFSDPLCCFDGHPAQAIVKTPATGAGTLYLCCACSSFWLVPWDLPLEQTEPGRYVLTELAKYRGKGASHFMEVRVDTLPRESLLDLVGYFMEEQERTRRMHESDLRMAHLFSRR